MLKTDDFEEASKKFKEIYNALQHLSVNINVINAVFRGGHIKPTESIRFITVVFDAGDKTPEIKN